MRNLIEAIWPSDNSINTLLDLGCGDLWFTASLPGVTRHIGVDIWQNSLDKAIAKNVPGFKPYCTDIREFIRTQADSSYDCVAAIDVIEHFDEEEAKFLITQIDRVTSKLAIIWTTLGHIYQAGFDNNGLPNPFQRHLSGPTVEWFPEAEGWHVDTYPEWHGDRGGAIFVYKFKKAARETNLLP